MEKLQFISESEFLIESGSRFYINPIQILLGIKISDYQTHKMRSHCKKNYNSYHGSAAWPWSATVDWTTRGFLTQYDGKNPRLQEILRSLISHKSSCYLTFLMSGHKRLFILYSLTNLLSTLPLLYLVTRDYSLIII